MSEKLDILETSPQQFTQGMKGPHMTWPLNQGALSGLGHGIQIPQLQPTKSVHNTNQHLMSLSCRKFRMFQTNVNDPSAKKCTPCYETEWDLFVYKRNSGTFFNENFRELYVILENYMGLFCNYENRIKCVHTAVVA